MNTFRSSQLLTLVCASLMLGACVQSGSSSGSLDLDQRVQQHDMQLRQMQPAQADAWNQLQAMRQELNTLKGQMDDLQNAGGARALVERVNRHDAALRQVESSMALNLNLGDPMPATPAVSPISAAPAAAPQTAPPAASLGTPMTGAPAAGQAAQGNYGLPDQGTYGQPRKAEACPPGSQRLCPLPCPRACSRIRLPARAAPARPSPQRGDLGPAFAPACASGPAKRHFPGSL